MGVLISMVEYTIDAAKASIETARAGSAERMRRRRARQRAGFRCFMVEPHRTEIDTLVRRGLLGADERDDEGASPMTRWPAKPRA
jgi:hypothetical protein